MKIKSNGVLVPILRSGELSLRKENEQSLVVKSPHCIGMCCSD